MCTSYVVHSNHTYIGMNFDISTRPIKIILQGDNQLIILQQENGQFFPAFGFNSNGVFMNLLMVMPNEEGKYRRGKNAVHIMRLFEDLLGGQIESSSLKTYLSDHAIVNVPNYSVHSMIVGKNRNSFIVEPGRQNLDKHSIDRDFMVLTNFPVSDFIDVDYTEVNGAGSDRYKMAYEMILNHKGAFNKEAGFAILKETMQQNADYPTLLSMISIPEENTIYFTLNGNFNRIYEFSFLDKQIRTSSGFTEEKSFPLSKKGILLSELNCW